MHQLRRVLKQLPHSTGSMVQKPIFKVPRPNKKPQPYELADIHHKTKTGQHSARVETEEVVVDIVALLSDSDRGRLILGFARIPGPVQLQLLKSSVIGLGGADKLRSIRDALIRF